MKPSNKLLRVLSSAAVFYYATIWLVVLVVIGTISQKFFGLQASLEKYFSAWFIQPMDMPLLLPSGRLVMAIILFNLVFKLIFATKWKIKMIGINITHLGVLSLMVGGVITAYTTIEGNLVVQEGSESSTFKDFHQLEIAVTDRSHKDYNEITSFTDGFFSDGQTFSDEKTPFTFKVIHHYKNCEPVRREASDQDDKLRQHAARFQFKELTTDTSDLNAGGVEVEISGADKADNGVYVFFFNPRQGGVTSTVTGSDGKKYDIELRPRHYQLPFTVYLKDFEKLDHAGTMMARAYSSTVTITEGESTEDLKIYMNHPLRRHGYTLYQSSFDQSNPTGIETSIFQVVYNKGQLMPYIAVIIITLGLLIHCTIQVPRLLDSAKPKAAPTPPSHT